MAAAATAPYTAVCSSQHALLASSVPVLEPVAAAAAAAAVAAAILLPGLPGAPAAARSWSKALRACQKHYVHTLNRLLGGLEAQAHILVPALATLAWDLASGLLEPEKGNHKQAIGDASIKSSCS